MLTSWTFGRKRCAVAARVVSSFASSALGRVEVCVEQFGAVQTVEVHEFDRVEVHDSDMLDAGSGKHLEHELADASRSHYEDPQACEVSLHLVTPGVNGAHLTMLCGRNRTEGGVIADAEPVGEDPNARGVRGRDGGASSSVPPPGAPCLRGRAECHPDKRVASDLSRQVRDLAFAVGVGASLRRALPGRSAGMRVK